MAQTLTLTQSQSELRERVLSHIYNKEHSSRPMKRYRVISRRNTGRVEHLTIESRTKIGAIIAYVDWKLIHIQDRGDWDNCDDKYNKSFNKIQFKGLIKLIVMHSYKSPGLHGEYLVDITKSIIENPIIIRPFE